jgi:hypothetical protein
MVHSAQAAPGEHAVGLCYHGAKGMMQQFQRGVQLVFSIHVNDVDAGILAR